MITPSEIVKALRQKTLEVIPAATVSSSENKFTLSEGGYTGESYFNIQHNRRNFAVRIGWGRSRYGQKMFNLKDGIDDPKIVAKITGLANEMAETLRAELKNSMDRAARSEADKRNKAAEAVELAAIEKYKHKDYPGDRFYTSGAAPSRGAGLTFTRQDNGSYSVRVDHLVHLNNAAEAAAFAEFLLGGKHMSWADAEPFEVRSARMNGPRSAMGY